MLNPLPCNTKSPVTHAAYRSDLKKKILMSQKQMREKIKLNKGRNAHALESAQSPRANYINAPILKGAIYLQALMNDEVKALVP